MSRAQAHRTQQAQRTQQSRSVSMRGPTGKTTGVLDRRGSVGERSPGQHSPGVADELTAQIYLLIICVGAMWVLESLDQSLSLGLDALGIIPRHWIGLRGILFAPLLHGSFPHLLANTVPFFTLGWLVMLRRTQDFIWVSLTVMLLGGFGTWLLGDLFHHGPPMAHVGASILIFGYLGFLMLRGYFERRPGSILLSVTVIVIYGSLLWGALPGQSGISWEGHLSGFLAGIVSARLLADKPRSDKGFGVRGFFNARGVR